jgi:2-desacetyl-2-hydroxyethyl bacteriochlorophyllide A dehydrogenase
LCPYNSRALWLDQFTDFRSGLDRGIPVMRKILLTAPGKFVDLKAPRPVPASGEALVRVHRVGVCGSDFHASNGKHPVYTYPRVLGHELAGEIVEVPENARGLKVGDRCAIEPYISCGQCRTCKAGRTNCCERLRLIGVHVDGGMQGFLAVPVELLYKSEQLSLDQLALVETLGIGAHAVKRSGLRAGEDALVVGAGPIGLAVSQFAAALGAKVAIIEINDWRREFVQKLGIESLASADGRTADVVFDATGSAVVMGNSLSLVAPGGKLVFVGLTRDPVKIDDALLHRREVTLYASRNSCGQFQPIIRMLEEKKINTEPWITDRLRLDEVPARFQDLATKIGLMKAVVEVRDSDG